MTSITTSLDEAPPASSFRLPLSGLLALAAAGFITVLTEALPAGLLPQMGASLAVPESLVGQLVTIYALGSLIAAIPLTAATRGWRRKPLLLSAIGGFAIVNTVTAVSTSYTLTLGARFFAGVFAGLLWALVAGYAGRMVPDHMKGKAMAVAMLGAPIALSLGVPAGTFLGAFVGWQYTFGIMSGLTVLLVGWTIWKLPDFPGQEAGKQLPISGVFAIPGVKAVLFVTLTYVVAHNVLYTYIAPFLVPAGLAGSIDKVLFVFGLSAILGTWMIGLMIDRWLRELTLICIAAFAVAAVLLAIWSANSAMVYLSFAIWGVTYGGVPTLFQTASAKTAGDAADVAQSMIVTVWNIGIAGGGIIGGFLLETTGVTSFSWVLLVLLALAFIAAVRARSHGFPAAVTAG
ncbi:putative MFS family arabinose efflux permease [Phyllobacterium myrsinacearum]|uniref:MFS transporter n=1 Tax=Phyllobacterium myrsinacearum TaxID=28101 RepID=UPI00102A78A5|nr:MFS transporter [Phyllobacterium myrsinacearum]RZS88395.1 putative MFS family arabinose efflux permease [Phyllobacterium myrsinacearum]